MANKYMNWCSTSTNHKGHVNQNQKHLTHVRMAIIKRQEIISVGMYAEKETQCTVDGNVNWYDHHGKQYRDSSKY